MRPTPYVASLRVYEPLEAFEPADQLRWSAISMNELTGREEQIRALQRIIAPESPALRADRARHARPRLHRDSGQDRARQSQTHGRLGAYADALYRRHAQGN